MRTLKNKYIFMLGLAILSAMACKKEKNQQSLPEGSIAIHKPFNKDTIQMPLSILEDSPVVLSLKAELSDEVSSTGHWVNFSVDTTRILDYRARFGAAEILPYSSYIFLKKSAFLPAGASVTDSIALNITQQTKLSEYTTYVLPVTVESVDGKTDAVNNRVLYLVFKTGKPLFIKRTGWTIQNVSSENGSFVATRVIDNDLTSYWSTPGAQKMPQSVTIAFNREIVFTAVNYSYPERLKYPTQGGYPTSIKIETSMDNKTWIDKGTFAGNIVNNTQTIPLGMNSARYLRFTSLAVAKFAKTLDVVFISDITLMP